MALADVLADIQRAYAEWDIRGIAQQTGARAAQVIGDRRLTPRPPGSSCQLSASTAQSAPRQ